MSKATDEQVNNACINIDGETWADIPDYEGIYQVSSVGRVKHIPSTIFEISSAGEVIETHKTREYILKQCNNRQEYGVVGLTKNGKVNSIGVHRLVALAFIPRLPGQLEVHHKDLDRQNNSIDNLQWVTPSEHDNLHRIKPRHTA